MSDFENKGVSPLEGEGIRGDGQAKWYVVHTYSGHENKVKVNIEKMVENRGMQDLIIDIVVPTEDRVEIKDGQRKIKTRKMFPGYVIIKMIVTNESWYLVRNTQGVTGFVGHGSEPIPLTDEEVTACSPGSGAGRRPSHSAWPRRTGSCRRSAPARTRAGMRQSPGRRWRGSAPGPGRAGS